MQTFLYVDSAPVLGHLKALTALGAPQGLIEKALGLSQAALERRDTSIPFLQNIQMIEKGMALLGNDVPLKLGTRVSLKRLGVCGYIFQNCRSVQEAAEQFIRYQKLLYAVSEFKITSENTVSKIEHSIKLRPYGNYDRITTELAFSSMITILRELVGGDVTPLRVEFSFEKPGDVSSHREIFRSPLGFSRDKNIIVFRKELLARAIPGRQSYIKYLMTRHADSLLKKKEDGSSFKNEVMEIALELLPDRGLSIASISKKLNMSRWTLTRKLKKEGLNYSNLIDGLKKDIALDHLENSNLSISEISFLLGYSEVSAFRRAFKKWTARTPRNLRERQP